MKNNVVPLIVLMVMSTMSFSQQLSPNLVSSQSGFDRSDQLILEWTLGETIIETIASKNTMYSQGFHQPIIEVDSYLILNDNDLMIFPNPVKNYLNIRMLSNIDSHFDFKIYDSYGRSIKHSLEGFLIDNTVQLDVNDLPSGIYFLRISNTEGDLKSYKFIKR